MLMHAVTESARTAVADPRRIVMNTERSSIAGVYREPAAPDGEELALMRWIDEQYLATPFYGSRRMTAGLRQAGHQVNRKRVQRLMRLMGLEALGPKPKTSRPSAQHRIYPYLLRGLTIDRPNQVWATDITYIPMARGFLYLVAVMDWYSRYVLAWRLSNTMDTSFCLDALEDALRKGRPEIFNTDQGAQFTSTAFTDKLETAGCGSAWTAAGAGWTTSSSSGCGAA